mmetsp:Transcript_26235/g.64774  ORF Transcript_26235/g.64774 Transcript_26235/m.64774 type:complete len:368 (+) Transcript_26235:29-1132(+)
MAEDAIPLDRVKDLQEKVDALVRTLVGTGGQGMERGLEHLLCADGFDVETGKHKAPELSRRGVLDKYYETVARLDEVARRSAELFAAYSMDLLIPKELTAGPSEIPDSTVSILIPEIQERNAKLQKTSAAASATGRAVSTPQQPAPSEPQDAGAIGEAMRQYTEAADTLIRDALKGTKGQGLRQQPKRMSEPGWSDGDAEKVVLGLVLTDATSQGKIVAECRDIGLKAADFQDPDHERLWEVIEKLRASGQIKDDTQQIVNALKREAGDGKKTLFTRLEALGKKNAGADYLALARSVVLKARLKRAFGAVSKGMGLKAEPLHSAQGAAKVVPQAAAQRTGSAQGAATRGAPQPAMPHQTPMMARMQH